MEPIFTPPPYIAIDTENITTSICQPTTHNVNPRMSLIPITYGLWYSSHAHRQLNRYCM